MISIPLFPLFALLLVPFAVQGVQDQPSSVVWNELNCRAGVVTDFVCCKDKHCSSLVGKSCANEDTCLWDGDKNECKENRDADNNVCCRSKVSDLCSAIAKGKCPDHFQIESKCCSESASKYEGILVSDQGKVCCNNPCAQAESNACAKPSYCDESHEVPNARSLGGGYGGGSSGGYGISMGGYSNFGFNPSLLPSVPGLGQMHQYPGLGGTPITYAPQNASGVSYVDEITVDDLIDSLIEALKNDHDVYTSSNEMYSDPLYGKTKFSSPYGGMNYLNPDHFIDQIYGNPYGMSLTQYGFGGQGFPIAPQQQNHGYGNQGYGMNPSHGQSGYGTQNQGSYGGHGGYGQNQGGYGGQGGYGQNQGGYGGQGSYGQNQGGYGGQGGYGQNQGGYGSQGGYGQNQGGQGGYGQNQGGYGGQSSYGQNQGGYGGQSSYGQNQGGYGGQISYGQNQGGYGGQISYGQNQGGYGGQGQGGHSNQGSYGVSSGSHGASSATYSASSSHSG